MPEEEIVREVVSQVLARIRQEKSIEGNHVKLNQNRPVIYCNYSNRHCHVSREDLDQLFGAGYQLTKMKDLIQPGEFATNEIITIVGPSGDTLPVRILGPIRPKTQVEISRSDSFALKIKNVPVRESGQVEGSPGAVLVGPKGAVTLKEGIIIAWRHIHFKPEEADYYGVKDRDRLRIRLASPERSLVFENVVARVKSSYSLEMHIDVDEANAAGVGQMTEVEIIK